MLFAEKLVRLVSKCNWPLLLLPAELMPALLLIDYWYTCSIGGFAMTCHYDAVLATANAFACFLLLMVVATSKVLL